MAAATEDRLVTLSTAGLVAAFAFVLAAFGAAVALATVHNVDAARLLAKALRFAFSQPAHAWPVELKASALLSLGVAFLTAWAFAALFWDHAWWLRPRRLDDQGSADALTRLSPPKNELRIFGGRYGGRPFFGSVEDRALVFGPPGSGKTSFLINQILRSTKAGISFAAVDYKPELHDILAPSLEAAGYEVIRVNPCRIDPGAHHWNPLQETDDETELAEIVASLLPILDPRADAYVRAQQGWLKMAVMHAKTWPQVDCTLPNIMRFLSSKTDAMEILEEMQQSPSEPAARIARRMIAGLNAKKPNALTIPALSQLGESLDYLTLQSVAESLGQSDFKMTDIGKGARPQAVFLQIEEARIKALGPLAAVMSNGLLTALISNARERKPVFIYLDEIGNFPAIPGLVQKLNTIRSRLMPTWLYCQSPTQLDERYGDGGCGIFMAACDVQMIFRLNDDDGRQLFCRLVGTTEQNKITISSNDHGGSVSRTRERVNVIEPHQLGELKPGQVVTLYRGASAMGRATPHYVDFPEFKRK